MKRNQSARPANFKVNTKSIPKLGVSDSDKIQNLRNRLIERGLGSNPLPSVRKPKVAESSKRLQTVQTIQSFPTALESKLSLIPNSSRISITGHTSSGALRPSSAIKNLKIPASFITRTANQPSRPCTARTNITSLTRINTNRNLTENVDIDRVNHLIDKLTNRPTTANREFINTPLTQIQVEELQDDYSFEESKLDEFIRNIKEKNIQQNEFVYLLREPVGHKSDYEVVSAEVARNQVNGEFFTLSAAGLSTFVLGSPVEFIKFKEFLNERKQFFKLKEVGFFEQFRVWKIVKMWQRNVNRYRRNKRKKELEEKLYSVDLSYSKVLLVHRQLCLDLEKTRFVDIPGHLDQMTLKEFIDRQEERIGEVRSGIEETSKNLRMNIKQGIINIMNELREEIVMDIAEKKNYGKLNLQMFPQVRKICPLYEKMGFPENMSYDQRADLRKACSRYIRFTYLVDFIALESLQNLYLSSVKELLLKIYEQINGNSQDDGASDKSVILQAENKKRNRVPLFKIELRLERQPVIGEDKFPMKTEFVPRKSPAEDFHPNIHLSFDNENLVVPCYSVKNLEKNWLKLFPERSAFVNTLKNLVFQGLEVLRKMQRWSKHPDIEDYVSALEEWDDKVADKWIVAEDINLDIIGWLEDSPYLKRIHEKLNKLIKTAFKDCKSHFSSFSYSLNSYYKNLEIDYSLLEKENLLQKVDSFDWTFSMFKAQKAQIEKSPKIMDSGLFRIDCLGVKNFFIQNSKDSLKKSQEILLKIIRNNVNYCKTWASRSARVLGTKIFSVEEFVTQKIVLQEVNEQISDIKRTIDLLGYLFNLGLRSEIGLNSDDTDIFMLTTSLMTTLNGYIINIESTNTKNTAVYKKKLKYMVPDFLQEVEALSTKIMEEKYLRVESNPDEMIHDLQSMKNKCQNFSDTAKNICKFQEVLQEPVCAFVEVQNVAEQVDAREKLWRSLIDYQKLYQRLQYTVVKQVDYNQATMQAEECYKVVRRSESLIQNSSVLDKLKSIVSDTLELMPIVSALRAPFLDSHWKMLREFLGEQFEITETLTLSSLKKFKIKEFAEEIQSISVQASQEHELMSQLKGIVELWEEMEIPLQQFKEKDLYILGDIEEFTLNLEDSLSKISLISGNRYITPLRDEVNLWRAHLTTVHEVLEEWATLQKTWMYFSAIFASQDIKRRLASESQTYESVDKFYRHFMKRVNLNNNAIKIMVTEGKLLEQLKKFNNSLEIVQKNLSQYLEDKRVIFPRFYFISDDELLKVLAQAGNPLSLQPLISKCFENINKLEFGEDLKAADIIAMVSSEGETVGFGGRVLKARGNVEEWLGNVQWAMVDTLMKAMKYCKDDSDRMQFKPWVLSQYPAQIIATVGIINWSIETDLVLSAIHDSPNAFKEWINTCFRNLGFLVDLVKSQTNELKRKLIVSMITTAVHHRDIVLNLQELGVETNSDFAWQKQLRYYWDGEVCLIKQINFATQYAYEYLGCTSRLVVTPLTEKCWITITSAINVKLGASPSGPAGTGKTESTKDLAKALGQFCIVFNCSEQITYKMTSRLFSGLIQQGAWSCLDEFNRIDIEVLSVIAQQLQTIKNAQLNNSKEFIFEARKISVKSGFGVFVTMNPGYAGRTELPDNLKVLFRPVSMMIPDYSMIAEIMLLAEGFKEGSRLSKKIVQLYKLANEQLSSQYHYDFGLRALKSVLLAAGEIRRKTEETIEELILIQSMNESNLPKLVNKDLLLFKALVKDLFPGIVYNKKEDSLTDEIIKKLQEKGLQYTEGFVKKICELNDTMVVRFGSMILGPAMSGKSTILNTLAKVRKIQLNVLNPKAVSIGELYGDMNHLTQDWKDGLASAIFREITNCDDPGKRWVVFDGPVDSLWIESMNTVLDDNMMLCLPNGERIKLKPSMRILFEVMDLSKASPATVSRCGMVYIPPENLTWSMLSTTWLQKIEPKELKDLLSNLFLSVVPLIFRTYDSETDMIPSSEIHKVRCLCNLLTILLKRKPKLKHVHSVFAFACIWTLGALLDSSKHERFSNTIRHIFAQTSPFPITDTVFEYFLDSTYNFKLWKETIPTYYMPKSASLSQILIPTTTTVAYTGVLKLLSSENLCSLLVGASGVGKSAIISLHITDLLKSQDIDLTHANFSARTSSEKTQIFIESKLERKASGVYSGSSSKKLFIYIDDVSMPAKDAFDSQPPIELLRQILDSQGFYDRKKGVFKKLVNFLLVCAAGNSNLKDVTPRFLRHFHTFYISQPSHTVMSTIFTVILSAHFDKSFMDSIRKSVNTIILSSIELYEKVVNKLKPTPSKFHYKYNLRDIGKIIQGITLTTPNSLVSVDKLTKVWLHECSRVFFDRLNNEVDRVWFNKAASITAIKFFKSGFLEDDWLETHPLMFTNIGNLENNEKVYEEIVDKRRIKRIVMDRLDDFNVRSKQKMQLEMFEEALAHVVHICRGLQSPRGHMMLIGVGGSGKQSLAILSSYILQYDHFLIQLSKNYNIDTFHEDIKKLMSKSGIEGKNISFIFPDQHMIHDAFLEDINSLINSGEVSDIYTEEELETILNALRPEIVDKQNIEDTIENIYSEFVKRVRDYLHIVLCTSPVGTLLRNRCRMFPSFVNCSTIEWFENWPEEALLSVAGVKFSELQVNVKGISNLASFLHLSSESYGISYYKMFKKPAYVTPKLFFDFFEVFSQVLKKTLETRQAKQKKLSNGLSKLHETRKIIAESQIKLQEMVPDLEIQKKKAESYYLEVQKETKAAVQLQETVEKETEFIEIQASECKLRAEDAERDLAEATPILESAMKAVQALEKNKKDIIEFKKYLKPPEAAKMVMEAVCILLNERNDWNNAVSVMCQMDFLQRLINYPKESVPPNMYKKLRVIVTRPEFQPEIVAQSSEAAKSLCIWCIAIFKFSEVYQIVKPKREKVALMQIKLKADMDRLESKQLELREVEEKVKLLKDECAKTELKVNLLEKDIKLTMDRVQRAELLLSLLAEEGIKWAETVQSIESYMKFIEVESVLNASFITYFGVFTDKFRENLRTEWLNKVKELQLPISEDYSFISTTGRPIDIREWQIAGLPKDSVSIENSIIVMNSCKWPILIDPQDQARRWLKNSLKSKGLVSVKPAKPGSKELRDIFRVLESALTQGKPVLLEDVLETMDSSLGNLIGRKFYKKEDGRVVIKLTDHEVMYDSRFFMILLCKSANPQFLPEIFGNLNVVNFTVTEQGLEDQLLVEVVRLENPKLERERDDIIVSLSNDQKLLEELQNSILDMIADSQGYILDNLNLISALQRSKSTSKDIARRVLATTSVEKEVNSARDVYRDIAIRGSILFFVITSMPGINPMYQHSLAFYSKLYCNAITSTPSSSNRTLSIIENITKTIFNTICRGLFEKDKRILAFLIAAGIWKHLGKISPEAWKLFIRGGGLLLKKNSKKNPIPQILSEIQWDFICKLEKVSSFQGISEDFILNFKDWELFLGKNLLCDLPPGKFELIDQFSRLLLIKALRPEKVMYGIDLFAQEALGKYFGKIPSSELEPLFEESDKKTPIVFILSQGTDPIDSIMKISRDKGMIDKLIMISLGQGQGVKAQDAFEKCKTNGGWLLLQNCHLSRSWLPTLETLIDNLQDDNSAHRDFRLILTSMPSDYFPVSILQNSLKITTEPPSGIKSNILTVFSQIDTSSSDVPRPEIWKKMIFGISFFHALTVERRKFGPLGFNIRYEFNESDFLTSIKLLRLLLEENEDVPWEGIQYIIGNINYGGRVTDKNDQVCLMAMFNKCCNAEMLEENYYYTENEVYGIPLDIDYMDYIQGLPNIDPPEVFGMNINAQITLETQVSESILHCLVQTEPKELSSEASDSDKTVHSMCKSLSISLSEKLDHRAAHNDLLVQDANGLIPSLSTFLFQEVEKFNRLLETMHSSLKELRNAIKGKVVMTDELFEMYSSLLCSNVPEMWKKVAYPSLKKLAAWVSDLTARVKFVFDWVKYGSQNCFWLSGFFFPQSFLTAVLQTHSRKYSIPIDQLVFTYEVTQWSLNEFKKSSKDGVFVYGLYLEGARWDNEEMILVDALEKEIYFQMPVIHFLPTNTYVAKEGDYLCPVYKTAQRAGVLSSTGLSTNFVVYVDLSSEENPDKWTLLGVALMCQIND